MESTFKTWKTSRKLFLPFLEEYTPDQLNNIPDGFSNNLIWNIGHIVVAQQALIYKSCGLKGVIPNRMYLFYKPGSKPTCTTSIDEINELKALLISTVDKTIEDFNAGAFQNFQERMTGTSFYLSSLEDAFEFVNFHEGLHLGYMANIRKFV